MTFFALLISFDRSCIFFKNNNFVLRFLSVIFLYEFWYLRKYVLRDFDGVKNIFFKCNALFLSAFESDIYVEFSVGNRCFKR